MREKEPYKIFGPGRPITESMPRRESRDSVYDPGLNIYVPIEEFEAKRIPMQDRGAIEFNRRNQE